MNLVWITRIGRFYHSVKHVPVLALYTALVQVLCTSLVSQCYYSQLAMHLYCVVLMASMLMAVTGVFLQPSTGELQPPVLIHTFSIIRSLGAYWKSVICGRQFLIFVCRF